MKPSLIVPAQVRRNPSRCSNLAGLTVQPLDKQRPRVLAEPHKAAPNEPVQVQFQAILKASPQTFSWHCISFELIRNALSRPLLMNDGNSSYQRWQGLQIRKIPFAAQWCREGWFASLRPWPAFIGSAH